MANEYQFSEGTVRVAESPRVGLFPRDLPITTYPRCDQFGRLVHSAARIFIVLFSLR
jgi:hypothetical protein